MSELQTAVAGHVAHGWRMESGTDSMAVLVSGQRPNHILHAILTLFTLGAWAPVWLIVALTISEKRITLITDDLGGVRRYEPSATMPQREPATRKRRLIEVSAIVGGLMFLFLILMAVGQIKHG